MQKTVLLVEGANAEHPRPFLELGFIVFRYSLNGYTTTEIVAEYPHDVNQKAVFPPGGKVRLVVFRRLSIPPPDHLHRECLLLVQEHVPGLCFITQVFLFKYLHCKF